MDLLYIRHPDPHLYEYQLELLNNLREPKKSHLARSFRLGNASMRYYYCNEEPPTEDDFNDWVYGLSDTVKESMIERGYQKCKTILGLQRHAMERRDIGMAAFVRNLLNDEDFEVWQKSFQDKA
jgi:hypothetical protein